MKKILLMLTFVFFNTASFAAEDTGAYWGFWGDSQTAGRAPTESSCTSSPEAIENVRPLGLSAPSSIYTSGVGGCPLFDSNTRYDEYFNKSNLTWVHFQESGGQDRTGQTTAEEFVTTFETTMTNIATDSPNAIITYETAFSFGREAEDYRDWTEYNTQMYSSVETLALSGITVIVADVDSNIKALQTALSPADVWYQEGDDAAYHYTALGNFMVSITVWEALGYSRSELNTSAATDISEADRNTVLDIVYGVVVSSSKAVFGASGTKATFGDSGTVAIFGN